MSIPLHMHENVYYAAFQVHSIFMVGALGEYARLYASNPQQHSEDMLIRNIEFINTLLQQSDERFTYDLRITSQPNRINPHHGRIGLSFVCAMRTNETDARTHAQSLFRLLNAQFTDLNWAISSDIRAIIDPWTINYAASLSRCSEFYAIQNPVSNTRLFPRGNAPNAHSRLFYVHAFIMSMAKPHSLYNYLLQHDQPVSLSIRLQRSHLTPAEVDFCQANIRTHIASNDISDAEFLSHRERGQYMHQLLLKQQQIVTLITIDIVSPAAIPTHLITLFGNLITQTSTGIQNKVDPSFYTQMGGYQVRTYSDYRAVADAYRTVHITLPTVALPQPHDRLPYLYDVNQAAIVLRLPSSDIIPLPGIEMQSHRKLRPPRDLSNTGTVIGEYSEAGNTAPIHINATDRSRHCYIIGQTGTGKSTVLKSMILDDIQQGRGVCAIDPHGDLVNEILAQIPAARIDDVVVIDPMHSDAPVGLNVLEYDSPAEREQAIQLFHGMMMQLLHDRGVTYEMAGPVFERFMRNNAYWVTQDSSDPGTVLEFYQMLEDEEYHKRWFPIDESDAKLVSWRSTLRTQGLRDTAPGHVSMNSWMNSKFEEFIFDTRIRLIFGQKRSTIDFFEAMNSQKIVLVNLSRGLLSEVASAFMGYIVLAKIQQAALKRAELPHHQRPLFSVYVDEFQNYTTESFVSLLSESRKYGIALTLANQFLSQIENKRIVNAIMGNVGTVISFRVGIADGDTLKARFAPEVTPDDLINLPNWQAYVSTQVNGQSRRPFSMHTIRPLEHLDTGQRERVIQHSKLRYGTPREQVERILQLSMSKQRTPQPETSTDIPTAPVEPAPDASRKLKFDDDFFRDLFDDD